MEKVLAVYPDKCTGCGGCELACSLAHGGEFRPYVSRIKVLREESGDNLPKVCVQCADAACMAACKFDAISRCDSGVVCVNEEKCVGCKMCVKACPYGVMFFNAEAKKAIKCDTCKGEPMCAKYCPTKAIEFSDDTPAVAAFAKKMLEVK